MMVEGVALVHSSGMEWSGGGMGGDFDTELGSEPPGRAAIGGGGILADGGGAGFGAIPRDCGCDGLGRGD